jgi:MoxR-like ATPase
VPLDVPRPPEEARPILVITSNGERDLPEPFLRRCVYCHIPTPDSETRLTDILLSRLAGRGAPPDLPPLLVRRFRALLADGAWKRRPGVAEMVAWARGIVSQVGMSAKLFGTLQPSDPEFCTEALAKTRDDVVRLTTKV